MPLRRSADFHLASGISSLVSLPLKPPERRPTPAGKQAQHDKPKRREGVFFGTLEGGLGAVLPVDEQVDVPQYPAIVRHAFCDSWSIAVVNWLVPISLFLFL